jgi:O-antigen/teichoic acid export membrane protein
MTAVSTLTTRKFVRDTLFANLPLPFEKLRTYLWLLIFAPAFGETGYGEWSLFHVSLNIMTALTAVNLGSAMMRFLSGDRTADELDAAWSSVLATVAVTTGVAAAALVLFSVPLAPVFGPDASPMLVILVGATVVTNVLFEEARGLLRARRMNSTWAGLTLARLVPETAVTVAVGLLTRSVTAVVLSYWLCSLTFAVVMVVYLYSSLGVRPVRPRAALLRRYLGFGAALLPGGLIYFGAMNADRYIVRGFLGVDQVGVYSAAVTISGLVFFFVGPINDVLFPELSALYDLNQGDALRRRFTAIQKFVLGVSAGLAGLVLVFTDEILWLATSGRFTSGGTVLAILAVQGLFMGLATLYIAVLNVQLRVWSSTVVWKVLAGIVLALDFALIPQMGITGAAVAQLVATVVAAAVAFYLSKELVRETFSPAWLVQLACGLAPVVAVRLLWPAPPGEVLTNLARLATAAAAYWAGLFASGYVAAGDLRVLFSAVAPAAWTAPGGRAR